MTARSGRVPPATRRVNAGRGHRYLLDGQEVDGVTRIVGDGVPKPALINWAANTTAGYAVDHWDELAELTTSKRLTALQKARFAERDAAAVRGTDVHRLALQLAAGAEVTVPEHLVGYVDAYLAFIDQWHVEELSIEATVINRRWSYMGTLDLIARLADGQLWLLDWKTGASGIWPETALQLAAYAHAETVLDDNGEHPMPEIDRAGAVWLRADGYDLIPVDITEATFRVFLYAQQLARFANAPREQFVHALLERPPTVLEVVQ